MLQGVVVVRFQKILMSIKIIFFSAFINAISIFSIALAGEYDDYLLGNLGGLRDSLSQRGVSVSIDYTGDIWGVSGGLKNGWSGLQDLSVAFEVDGEKAYRLQGNSLYFSFLSDLGSKTNTNWVGSTEGLDNIEVAVNATKLYEFWMSQQFLDDKASLLIGLYDLNSEFFFTSLSENFLKPVYEVSQELAQTGQNGPSVFPIVSMTARLKLQPTKNSYLQAAILDGVPGDPNNLRGTQVHFRRDDGFLIVTELGYIPEGSENGYDKLAVGLWRYTELFDDLAELDDASNPTKKHSQGIYGLFSYQFYKAPGSDKTLGFFSRGGVGDGKVSQVLWSYATGLVANGWIPNRSAAELGFGISESHNDSKYVQSVLNANGETRRNEFGLEAYYRDVVYPGVSVEPDLQYIVNPGTTPSIKNAFAAGQSHLN